MKDINYIIVAGYFSSGSSAITGLLKEFKGVYEGEAEIRIIKDPGGICELETALVDKWEIINSTAAIENFLNLCKICNRTNTRNPLSPAGLSYKKKVNASFMDISREYIEALTMFTYKSDYYFQKFKKSYLRYVIDRCRMGLEVYSKGKIKTTRKQVSYFAHPTAEEFSNATKDYFDKLFRNHTTENKQSYIVLDQAVSVNNPTVIHRFFNSAKMIVVERDPRDMYVDSIRRGTSTEYDSTTYEAGLHFALRQKAMRATRTTDEDVLYLHYEDLMLKYDETIEKICVFLGLAQEDHIYPRKYVIPENAKQYIGIWKKYRKDYSEALSAIEATLPEYCYSSGD